MPEVLRDLVVSLSLKTDNFSRNINSINRRIREAEGAFRPIGAAIAPREKQMPVDAPDSARYNKTYRTRQDKDDGRDEPIMKRVRAFTLIAILAMMVFTLAACGRSEFVISENTGKQMTVTAKNAKKDDSFMAGSLEVVDGERIVITASMTKGTVKVEVFKAPEGQSIDTLPEMDDEPIIMAVASSKEEASAGVAAGTYLLKATCLEKATGSVQIAVKPGD